MTCQGPSAADWRLAWQSRSQCARLPTCPGGGDRCGTVCHRKHRRQKHLRGHAAVSTSARRPGGADRSEDGRLVCPCYLLTTSRARTQIWSAHLFFAKIPKSTLLLTEKCGLLDAAPYRIRQRNRRRLTGAPALLDCPFLENERGVSGVPRPGPARASRPITGPHSGNHCGRQLRGLVEWLR